MPIDYQTAYDQLGNVYDPQSQLVQQQLAALPQQYQAQYSALDQAKINAFRDIDTSANAKGVLFSGFSPDQQAQYVGTKYLPARAALATDQQNKTFSLQDTLNKIAAARATQAQNTVAETAKAEQDAAYKQAQLQLGYARLGASQSKAASALPSAGEVKSAIQQGLASVRGRDGYVSPQDYATALGDWLAAGLDRAGFNKQYSNYRNPNNKYYDFAIKQAGL